MVTGKDEILEGEGCVIALTGEWKETESLEGNVAFFMRSAVSSSLLANLVANSILESRERDGGGGGGGGGLGGIL